MKKERVLITGSNGEVGTCLINHFAETENVEVVAVDCNLPSESSISKCKAFIRGSVLNQSLLKEIEHEYKFDKVFHLAGILSSGAERDPIMAHEVNVQGTFNMLQLARNQSVAQGRSVIFMFPSTIAIYGIPSVAEKMRAQKVREDQYLTPKMMYAHNKIYCENLGLYFTNNFGMLRPQNEAKIDFRCVRYPGIWSADTLPTGGTTDYAPEMIHAAAKGVPYTCFVRPDTQLPFMTMPDALKAIIDLSNAKSENLKKRIYNVGAFSMTADEIREAVCKVFPGTKISYETHAQRQSFVDMWPADVDDTAARAEWGWRPNHSKEMALKDYMIPAVLKHYGLGLKKAANS